MKVNRFPAHRLQNPSPPLSALTYPAVIMWNSLCPCIHFQYLISSRLRVYVVSMYRFLNKAGVMNFGDLITKLQLMDSQLMKSVSKNLIFLLCILSSWVLMYTDHASCIYHLTSQMAGTVTFLGDPLQFHLHLVSSDAEEPEDDVQGHPQQGSVVARPQSENR